MWRSIFRLTSIRLAVAATTTILVATSAAYAQQGEDLRAAAQNPVGDLISVPFQNNTNFDIGRSDNTQNILDIQPVYPIHLNPSWNLISRPILPVISQPPFFREGSFGPLKKSLALTSAAVSSDLGTSPRNS
jgi:hypothetical protein